MSNNQQFLVIDEHKIVLAEVISALQKKYPTAQILAAQNVQTAVCRLLNQTPDLVIVDLSLSADKNLPATSEVGVRFLESLVRSIEAPNIMVLSTNLKPLLRLKPLINAYGKGFVAIDKSFSMQKMLDAVDDALQGSICLPPEIQSSPEFDRQWLKVLKLKYQEGLSDVAIAKLMGISDHAICNYWIGIQNWLGICEHPDQDLWVHIQMAARQAGLFESEAYNDTQP